MAPKMYENLNQAMAQSLLSYKSEEHPLLVLLALHYLSIEYQAPTLSMYIEISTSFKTLQP